MEYFIRTLGYLFIPMAVFGFSAWARRRPKNIKEGRVYLPSAMFFSGIVLTAFCVALAIFSSFSEIYVSILFLGFALLSSILIIAYFNCYIVYNDYDFTQKTFFGAKHRHKYSEIIAIRKSGSNPQVPQDIIIYVGHRRVRVDGMAVGRDEFLELANQKYREKFGSDIPPKRRKGEKEDAAPSKLFNGHLKHPIGNIVLWVIAVLFGLSFAIFGSLWTFFPQILEDSEPVMREGVIFVKYELGDEDTLLLTDKGGTVYEIEAISHAQRGKLNRLISLCDSNTVCTLTGNEKKIDGNPGFSVITVSSPEGEVLSYEDNYNMHVADNILTFVVGIAMFILFTVMVVMSILIACHPERFKEKTVRFFYTEGSINY